MSEGPQSHAEGSSQSSDRELDVSKLNRTIISIEYPGLVKNDQEALRTMGGIGLMSAVHCKENRK